MCRLALLARNIGWSLGGRAADTTHDRSRAVTTIPNPNPDPNSKPNSDGGWTREAFTAAERSKIVAHRRRNADAARREEAARKAALELLLDEQKVRRQT